MTKKIIGLRHLYHLLLILLIITINGRFSTKIWKKTTSTPKTTSSHGKNITTSDATRTIAKRTMATATMATTTNATTTEDYFADLDLETKPTTTCTTESTIPTPSTDGTIVRFHGSDDFFYPLPNTTHNATVFFLHGLGNDGSWMKEWIEIVEEKTISLPYIKVIFPTAPARNSTYFEGEIRNIWFDRGNKTCNETEDLTSMIPSIAGLSDLIIKEVKSGIPLNKMVIGGYASGGAMAFHMAYRFFPEMAGVFGINSYLPSNSTVFHEVRQNKTSHLPQAFLSCGNGEKEYNEGVRFWAQETLRELCQLGVQGEFSILGKSEILGKVQLEDLWRWIKEILP